MGEVFCAFIVIKIYQSKTDVGQSKRSLFIGFKYNTPKTHRIPIDSSRTNQETLEVLNNMICTYPRTLK